MQWGQVSSSWQVLKNKLAANVASQGSGLVAHYDPVAPSYLKTVSDIINGEELSAFRFIDRMKHAGIKAGTNVDDLSSSFTDMASAGARKIKFPNGTYHYSDVELAANFTEWRAETKHGAILVGIADAVDMITVSGVDCKLRGFQLLVDAAVRNGSGNGVVLDAGVASQTQNGCDLYDMYIHGQPDDGVVGVKQEHGHIISVWCYNNGGRGFYFHDDGESKGIGEKFVMCRAYQNGGTYQWQITNQIGFEFNLIQSLQGGGSNEIFLQSGSGHIMHAPDVERVIVGGLGLLISGAKHKVYGGYFGKLANGIQANSATDVKLYDPRLVGDGTTPMTKGVEFVSSTGHVEMEGAPTNVTTAYSETSSAVTRKIGANFFGVNNRAQREVIASAASITPDASAGDIKQITLTSAVTINAPTNAQIGAVLTFNLIEDGTGGWNVTWNGAYKFNVAWLNVGNVAGTRSTAKFEYDGSFWRQIGQQAVWV